VPPTVFQDVCEKVESVAHNNDDDGQSLRHEKTTEEIEETKDDIVLDANMYELEDIETRYVVLMGEDDQPEEQCIKYWRSESLDVGNAGRTSGGWTLLWLEEYRPFAKRKRIISVQVHNSPARVVIASWDKTAKRFFVMDEGRDEGSGQVYAVSCASKAIVPYTTSRSRLCTVFAGAISKSLLEHMSMTVSYWRIPKQKPARRSMPTVVVRRQK
jgi:hypothetical protein